MKEKIYIDTKWCIFIIPLTSKGFVAQQYDKQQFDELIFMRHNSEVSWDVICSGALALALILGSFCSDCDFSTVFLIDMA